MSNGPIFIGGLSFSGKTQLRLLLGTHPNIVITRRTRMWTRFYGRFGDLSRPENFERCLEAMLRNKHICALNPDPARIREQFWQGTPAYERLFALIHEQHAERLGKPRWGDQLGSVEQYADPIFAAYPTARMIHLIRDPRARYAEKRSSESSSRKDAKNAKARRLDELGTSSEPERRENLAIFASSRQRFIRDRTKVGWETAAWRRSAQLAQRNRQRYPNRYLVLHNEQLLGCPEQTLREVYEFLDESFFPAALSKHESLASDNGRPCAISGREVAFIQTYAKPEMLALGYRPQPVQLSFKDRASYLLVDWPVNLAGTLCSPVC
jgi:hypothetical protein